MPPEEEELKDFFTSTVIIILQNFCWTTGTPPSQQKKQLEGVHFLRDIFHSSSSSAVSVVVGLFWWRNNKKNLIHTTVLPKANFFKLLSGRPGGVWAGFDFHSLCCLLCYSCCWLGLPIITDFMLLIIMPGKFMVFISRVNFAFSCTFLQPQPGSGTCLVSLQLGGWWIAGGGLGNVLGRGGGGLGVDGVDGGVWGCYCGWQYLLLHSCFHWIGSWLEKHGVVVQQTTWTSQKR